MNLDFSDRLNISTKDIMMLCTKAFRMHDPRLVEHGDRVAYIAYNIYQYLDNKDDFDLKTLLLLCVFHDVGAYKTEEIDRMIEFESENVFNHSVYGCLFLKYYSPLTEYSKVILYHHTNYDELLKKNYKYSHYANLIHLADRIDIGLVHGYSLEKMIKIFDCDKYNKQQVDALKRMSTDINIESKDFLNDIVSKVITIMGNFEFTNQEALSYLLMIVYTIDFVSEFTVVHTITTTMISLYLAEKFNFSNKEQAVIYFGSLVHDIGKIAIDESILESTGKLTTEQMNIMKKHVEYTNQIIEGLLPQEVVEVAIRHHEKLDGTGYPKGLKANDLSVGQRIVSVSDILCALITRRSYKEAFSKEKTLNILNSMANEGQIDKKIVEIVNEDFDIILNTVSSAAKPKLEKYNKIKKEYNFLITE